MDLSGKRVLITGGGGGLGRVLAADFAAAGADVHIASRRQVPLDKAAAAMPLVTTHQLDVTDEDATDRLFAGIGSCDIVIANAGIAESAPLHHTSLDQWQRIMAVNLRSVVLACKHTLPIMRRQGNGVILTISSIAAIESYPWVSYKASKSALLALTQQLAYQNAEYGVRANVILPGLMDTPMAVDTRAAAWGRSREDVAQERNARVPLRNKMGSAWDVAYAALFLASDEAGFITGAALPVDGGASSRVG